MSAGIHISIGSVDVRGGCASPKSSSFRTPQSGDPESSSHVVAMDSGFRVPRPRNDEIKDSSVPKLRHSGRRAAAIRNPWTVARYDIETKQPSVYILASKRNGTLYVGVTSDLIKRGWEHRNDLVEGFTGRYQVHRLVYFEQFESMILAIEREKELKKWRRAWKIALVEKNNPQWLDLWPDLAK